MRRLIDAGYRKSTLGGGQDLPAIIYGAGAFSNQYNTDDHLASAIPLRTVRLALRCVVSFPLGGRLPEGGRCH